MKNIKDMKKIEKLYYEGEVDKDAKRFLSEHADEIVELLNKSEERLSVGLRTKKLVEDLDRSYTPEDAVFVLENSNHEETDMELRGDKDWKDYLNTRASFAYNHDVLSRLDALYTQIYYAFLTKCEETEGLKLYAKLNDEEYNAKMKEIAKFTLSEYTEEILKQVEP